MNQQPLQLSLSLSPEITTNALHTLTLACKTEGKKDLFSSDSTEIILHDMPSAKPEIAGVDFHLSLLQGMNSCHYINLFQCHLCGLEFV